jgi:ring-1,2-phenylacetyl-CoA epoxidase subunit PaaC
MTTKEQLYNYILQIADDSLILGQRLSEWCGHGPILEEDIALTNIALDFIGQANNLYDYACTLKVNEINPDQLAFLRVENDFKNALLVEQPNRDFAYTLARQFYFDAFRKLFFERLILSKDEQLSAIAEKSLKETKYHLKHSSEWIIRLGDGTEESHNRIQTAIDFLWKFTNELFEDNQAYTEILDLELGISVAEIKSTWLEYVQSILTEATLKIPTSTYSQTGGRKGTHTEHLGYLLAEMQYMQRTYPNSTW